jgi:hypothetical protein
MVEAEKLVHTVLLGAQTITDGATATANLDCKGARHAVVIVNLGVEETTDATAISLALRESDDTVVTNFATVVANQSITSIASASQAVYLVNLLGRKRYLRLSVTAGTGTGSNLTFSANAITSRLEEAPASTTDMVGSTNDVVVRV